MPAPATEIEPSAPLAEPEPPRRRSTVREPAPIFGGHGAENGHPVQPPAAAIEVESAGAIAGEGEDANKPRRTGWWAKRLLGGKD
jgi:ribonuclease E